MKGFPPFQGEPGKPPPPSADPLRLIQFALEAGYPTQIINFGGCVENVAYKTRLGLETYGLDQEAKVSVLEVQAPVGVGLTLEGPPEEQDYLILIHVPRAAGDAMDSPIERPLIILPPGVH